MISPRAPKPQLTLAQRMGDVEAAIVTLQHHVRNIRERTREMRRMTLEVRKREVVPVDAGARSNRDLQAALTRAEQVIAGQNDLIETLESEIALLTSPPAVPPKSGPPPAGDEQR